MRPGIICTHLLDDDDPTLLVQPVLSVVHDLPQVEEDSGWSMHCSSVEHDDSELAVVDLDRYLDGADASLREVVAALPEGQVANRCAVGAPWVIEPLEEEQTAFGDPVAAHRAD